MRSGCRLAIEYGPVLVIPACEPTRHRLLLQQQLNVDVLLADGEPENTSRARLGLRVFKERQIRLKSRRNTHAVSSRGDNAGYFAPTARRCRTSSTKLRMIRKRVSGVAESASTIAITLPPGVTSNFPALT